MNLFFNFERAPWGMPFMDGLKILTQLLPTHENDFRVAAFTPVNDKQQQTDFFDKKLNIRNVRLFKDILPTNAMALGCILYEKAPKFIAMDIGCEAIDKEAMDFFLKHEVTHIKIMMGSC